MSFLMRQYRYFKNLRFVRDVFTMQAGTTVYMIATYAASIIFARVLGIDGYGAYAIALSFTATCNALLNLGQGSSLLIFFAEQYGKKSISGMSAVVRNYLHLTILNSLILLGLAFLTPRLVPLFGWPALIVTVIQIRLIADILDRINSMTIIMLQAVREIRTKVYLEQGANLLSIVLSVIAAVAGYGIEGMVWGQLAAGLIFLPVSLIVLSRAVTSHGLPSIRDVVKVPMHQTFPYLTQGFMFAVDKNIGALFPNGLFFALSLVAPASTVAMAKIAVQLSGVPRMILLPQVGDLSTTVLAAMRTQGEQVLRSNAAKIIKHATALFAATTFAGMIVSPFFIMLYGQEYLPALPLTLWLMLLSLPAGICVVNSPILRLYHRVHYSIIQSLLSWVVMVGALFMMSDVLNPVSAFAVAYGIGFALPCTVTAYIFLALLRRKAA